VKRARLEHGPYLAARVGDVTVYPAADQRLAARRRDEPEQHPQRRRLARAIWAQQADHTPRVDLKAEIIDSTGRPEILSQPVNRNLKHRRNPSW
jgi:hypothetical protein